MSTKIRAAAVARAVVGALHGAATAYIVGLLALTVIHVLAPQRSGLLALTQITAPHLFVTAAIAVPLAARTSARRLRLLLLALALVAVARFGQTLVSLPAAVAEGTVATRAVSWNLENEGVRPAALVAQLRRESAEIVALQELLPAHVDALDADDAVSSRFPGRAYAPHEGVLGLGLLSAYPVVESSSSFNPPILDALVDTGEGDLLAVVVAHPLPARLRLLPLVSVPVPVDLDASARDHAVRTIRDRVDAHLAAGRRVLLLGDFNVTEREPGYDDLAAGLRDAHLEAGVGPGFTWRPARFEWLPFGLLRIDYLFGSSALEPIASSVDCTPYGSDHCIVRATFAAE